MLRATLLRTLQASMPIGSEDTPVPYPLPVAFERAMSVVAGHASGMTAVLSLLHDNGLEWDRFYSVHEPAEVSPDRAYLLAQELLRAIDHVAALLPSSYVHELWNGALQEAAARLTQTVFQKMMKGFFAVNVPLPAKSPNIICLQEVVLNWCIANMPWTRESISSSSGDGGVTWRMRIAAPNPHMAVLQALRTHTTRCLELCEAEVPAPHRLELQHRAEWDDYFERIFPIAPEAWRPHLLTFLHKYPCTNTQWISLRCLISRTTRASSPTASPSTAVRL